MKKARIYLLLLSGFLMSACSTTTTFYNNVDWLVYIYIDDYVDLDSNQKMLLDARIKKWHAWHRSTELSKYKSDLVSLKEKLQAAPLSREQWSDEFSKARQHVHRLRDEISPDAIEVVQQLSDQQIGGLLKLWSENDRKEIDAFTEQGTAVELQAHQEKVEDLIEKYTGRLSAHQKGIVQRHLTQIESTFIEDMAYSKRLRTAVAQAFSDSNKPALPIELNAIVNNLESFKSQTLLATKQRNEYRYAELLSELNSSLDKEQRKRLSGKIDAHIETLQILIN
ncbi:DUF6279 family lipoprotein [Pseudomonas capsici]|uniref:DUF6279 family lipoprotein n=1 Tax=Pseudomonas capsici TaxID=2810614 RepID=UPI0021F210FD|nr:DUF6279 family lipoprotein [Pseudomonas capsici]MCV4263737.1 DUF6279 family lipoprotein [Pseudomonas capsici]